MKVLFISSGNSEYGISPIIKNQGESLKGRGIEIEYFTIKGKGYRGYFKNIFLLKKYLMKDKYDIFHAHYSFSAFTATLAGVSPLVVSLMGSDINSSNFFLRIIKLFYNIFWKKIIVKSEDMKGKLGINDVEIIPNGVDYSKFKFLPKQESIQYLRWDSSKKHILFAANPKRSEKNYKLAKDSIKKINIQNLELHFLENIPNEEMVYFFNASDVVLLTSFWEGSPNVIKEAMACNIPIVSTEVGDVKEVIGNTQGCFITTFEPEDVAEKIQKALKFGKRTTGRKDIKHLESGVIADKIIGIYKSILNK